MFTLTKNYDRDELSFFDVSNLGGSEKSGLDRLEDVAFLALNEKSKVKNGFAKSMHSFQHMAAFCKAVGSDWLWIVQLVATFGPGGVLELCEMTRKHIVDTGPDLWFSTVHASKGLEFDHVVLGEDFPPLVMPSIAHVRTSQGFIHTDAGRIQGSSMFNLTLK